MQAQVQSQGQGQGYIVLKDFQKHDWCCSTSEQNVTTEKKTFPAEESGESKLCLSEPDKSKGGRNCTGNEEFLPSQCVDKYAMK